MRRELLLAATALVWCVMPVGAQPVPRLTGTVDIDLSRGGLSADLCLSVGDAGGDSARFVLHRGLNVKRIRGGGGVALPYTTTPEPHGVGLRYAVQADTTRAPASPAQHAQGVCVEYTGAFPVYDVAAGDYAPTDGSGVVAFNGRTLRARGQSRWYPVPYDAETDQVQESMAYRLRLRCTECAQLYLNGAPPQSGPDAEFVTEEGREIVIVAGDFPVQRVDDSLIMGEEVAADTARLFVQELSRITRFYEEFLGVPFGRGIDFLRIIPVRFNRPFQMWGFFSDPLMGVTGVTVADFVEVLADREHPARPHLFGFLGHELAHRYFSGPLGGPHNQLFSEPFANYLGLKATRQFSGTAAYQEGLGSLHEQVVSGPDPPRLDEADPATLGGDHYRYRYVPLLLFALEREIGEARMRTVLRALLTAPADEQAQADYAFLRRTALRSGVPVASWQRWEHDCVQPPVSRNRCLQRLLETP